MAEAEAQTAPASIACLLDQATRTLRIAGIDNPRAEARLLLAHSLGVGPGGLIGRADEPVVAPGFGALLARRAAREPMAYVLGSREFRGMEFRVTPATLVPRPETETLIDAAIEQFPDRASVRRVLDLGTGTGCLLCAALAEFPGASGLGIDASAAALDVARANAQAHGFGPRARFAEGSWLAAVTEQFDLVLANPPYIARAEAGGLMAELGHEPAAALFAGEDGLDAFRAILPALGRVLAPAGRAVLEMGAGQAEAVAALSAASGLRVVALRHDLAGIARAIILGAPLAGTAGGVGNPGIGV